MVISSFGRLENLTARQSAATPALSITTYGTRQTYATLYRTQPHLRTVVEFLGRNIAQLGLHAFRRVSDTDRQRLSDHPLVATLKRPNPGTTRFRLIDSLVQDLGIYAQAYWLKVRTAERLGLVRLPVADVTPEGGLIPSSYTWTVGSERVPLAPSEVVHFRWYDPTDPLRGLSPIETLRRVLAEDLAATDYREGYWRNAARMSGVIERPKDAPKWTPEQRGTFRSGWQEMFSGASHAGRTAILEDGMTFKEMSYSASDSQYLEARKLTREEVAAAYHIPLPMVGILEHATFSNIKEQHKHLYQDCLGPWLVMIQEDLQLQLLPEWRDADDVYVEFNIQAKLAGSFEEQVGTLRTAIGKPFMTCNEGRARLNLPRSDRPQDDAIADPTYISGDADPETDAPPAEEGRDVAA